MILTKAVLASFAALVLAGGWRLWQDGRFEAVLDGLGGLAALAFTLFIDRDIRKAYLGLVWTGGALSGLYFFRLLQSEVFYPAGFLWLLSMMVFLLCFIKHLQNR